MTEDTRPRCRTCGMVLRDSQGRPFTIDDDVENDGICQWCRFTVPRREEDELSDRAADRYERNVLGRDFRDEGR